MRFILFLATILLINFSVTAQGDTTFLYFNESWKECKKDTAFYIGKVYQQGTLWERQDSWAKTGQLQMKATYLDKETTKPDGLAAYYSENGTLRKTNLNKNGKALSAEFFYESGKKKGEVTYTPQGTIQKGFDEEGNELPGYVVEREASFPGGPEGWRSYLEKNLNANVAGRSSKRIGLYMVKVQFIIDKEGNISNVNAIEVPSDCARCGKEAVRIIKNGPKWQPAMQDNKKVIYQAIQSVNFQVAE